LGWLEPPMILYQFQEDLSIRERGQTSLEDALNELTRRAQAAAKTYAKGEEAMAATAFGVCRDERDFLEITCNSASEVHCHTDRLLPRRGWKSWLARQSSIDVTCDLDQARKVLSDYFRLPREAFERAMAEGAEP
jgi:hypothetical protein